MQYERVYTVWDFHDGIRTGTADLNGVPHYFASLFDEVADEYTDSFKLYPVEIEFIERAIFSQDIYRAWERKFHSGEVDIKTHPGHRGINVEYDSIESWLDDQIAHLQAIPGLYKAKFRDLPGQEDIAHRILREVEVEWSLHPRNDTRPASTS
jgi:hypothetical protein